MTLLPALPLVVWGRTYFVAPSPPSPPPPRYEPSQGPPGPPPRAVPILAPVQGSIAWSAADVSPLTSVATKPRPEPGP
jgi:hypothetical protein